MARQSKKSEVPTKTPVGAFRLSTARMQVVKVYDGNTIQGILTYRHWLLRKVQDEVTVRLNGINCPELNISQAKNPDEFAVEITHYVKQRIEGKRVKIVAARKPTRELIRESYTEKNDPRLLAFVHPTFFGMKQEALNVKLVRKGWARRYSKPEWMTKEYHKQLLKAERIAKRRRAGAWRNHDSEAEPLSLNFWIGFILGALVGFAACFLWLTNR